MNRVQEEGDQRKRLLREIRGMMTVARKKEDKCKMFYRRRHNRKEEWLDREMSSRLALKLDRGYLLQKRRKMRETVGMFLACKAVVIREE